MTKELLFIKRKNSNLIHYLTNTQVAVIYECIK
jgi:hypothetical protein